MIGEDFGRLFEVGFNIGILAYIQRENIAHNFGDSYRLDLHKLSLPKMTAEITREANLLGSLDAKIVEKWSLFFVQKGFLGGLNFFREYLKSTGWNLKLSKILYCQCSFSDANSIRTYNKDEKVAFKEVLSQFKITKPNLSDDEINSYIRRYKKKGEFLQADTLILLQKGQDLRILCVDLSVFTPPLTSEKVDNINEIEVMRKSLLREISYLRSKSVFSNLRIDTSTLGVNFSEGLNRYFTAFKYKDKESAKLIQAGSYAHSFYGFLQATKMIPDDAEVLLNVVGYSDRTINAISLRNDKIEILANCAKIYQQESKGKEINDARGEVLDATQLNAARSFQNGKKFVNDLLTIGKTSTPVCNTERVDNFVNSIDIISDQLADDLQIDRGLHLRNAHAQLIFKALESEETYLFLTGNPGIGKTTAIANFLKAHIDDGFLFFYVSPRKQVNLDIIEKFRDQKTGLLCHNKLFCINTNSDIIKSNSGQCAVNYAANNYHENFQQKTVHFINDSAEVQRKEYHKPQLERKGETVIKPTSGKTNGVLNSICEGIYSLINRKTSNNIVATVSIQSLKVTEYGKNTLQHLEKIFQDAYNKQVKNVIPDKMQEMSSRIKHIFIMIDEITGDDSGVEFLHGIDKLVKKYELHNSKHGFNTKIIVADASIVDPDVIKQHLNDTSPEPDKIYFKKLPKKSEEIPPLQVTPFEFKRLAAKVINTNSYPASSLDITYKVFVESVKFTEDISLKLNYDLVKRVQSQIIEDINQRLAIPGVEQIIVYIQDKRRLTELIVRIRSSRERFEPFLDYLEVHANISEEEKEQIQKCKNTAKVIFMTASGSRGLSFPKTKHILVDIPRFQIEKNLMEVIQVIYRGRGEDDDGNTLDGEAKELVFYLSDTAVYYADDAELSLQESKLSLLNLLLILKTAVMTRIVGYGYLGRERFLMIPIGGKSISAVGDTFSSKIASLIKALKSEHRSRPQNVYFKDVYEGLEQLLSRGEFVLPNSEESGGKGNSYLEMRDNFNRKFLQMCNPLDGLLGYDQLEVGHVLGSLLLVPLADKSLKENYQMRLNGEIKKCLENQLLKKMETIANSKSSPENVKSAIRGGAIELLHILNGEIEKTQYFQQQSQQFDRYYAIPLFAFVSGEEMQEYFAQTKLEEPEDRRFRDILSAYVRSTYPIDSVMPIGHKYHEFPFIVFRSYSLEQSREKMFTDKYLLSSNELNVLNLILSKQDGG
ncbi:ATP-binding protein [Lyngbya sp. CCAP 1446/10]|uniref:ATP-binding protein n=1 Tax=Lyngbya sp. CCAP 1446/10 TaxID=439293 RepID=UPI002236FF3B|nr:ATP-binding protein [Lyngbya sp. CCAP 1446/10]MCW6053092.1 ATP-binding protein [Lyngbya sp. CCAP 1446/10]